MTLLFDSDALRGLLAACLFGMALLAALFLRTRHLSTTAYIAWGLLALLLPAIGPFLVIALRPGQPRLSSEAPIA